MYTVSRRLEAARASALGITQLCAAPRHLTRCCRARAAVSGAVLPAAPGELGRASHCKVGASPRGPARGARARRPKLGAGRRCEASPTFPRQEGGRPRAFPVVQLNRAETSLQSPSRGWRRPRGQSSGPSRAGRAPREGEGEGEAVGAPGSWNRSQRLVPAQPAARPGVGVGARVGGGGGALPPSTMPARPLPWLPLVPAYFPGGRRRRVFPGV